MADNSTLKFNNSNSEDISDAEHITGASYCAKNFMNDLSKSG